MTARAGCAIPLGDCTGGGPIMLDAKTGESLANLWDAGKAEGRYVVGSLPHLPYPDRSFDIALCSHFLFLYSVQLGYEFHRDSIIEMLRVAGEARIFPIVDLTPARSVHLDHLTKELRSRGFIVEFRKVDYEVQRGGNEMMRVRRYQPDR